jgi:hypothetical protein
MPLIVLITFGLLFTGLALAFWRGGYWERVIACALVVVALITSQLPFDGVNPPWVAISLDGLIFLLLLYACLRSTRRWLIFAAAFQFLVLATHYVFVQNHALMQWAYVSAYYVWNIGLFVSLCLGAVTGRGSRVLSSDKRRDQ